MIAWHSLDEIRRNRDGTAANLALQTESLPSGETLGGAINVKNEVVCEYEGLETVGISAHAQPYSARARQMFPRGPRPEARGP